MEPSEPTSAVEDDTTIKSHQLHAAFSNSRDDECEACAYCGLEFGRMHHEHDHMPVPKQAGGSDVVPACIVCHDLKDRIYFRDWHPTMLGKATAELLDLELLLIPEPAHALPDCWGTMSREARMAWAKINRLRHTNSPEEAHVLPENKVLALADTM